MLLQDAEQAEGEDCSKDLYGNLAMNRSQEKRPVTHTPLKDIGRNLSSQTVTVRARLHTSRGKGIVSTLPVPFLSLKIKDQWHIAQSCLSYLFICLISGKQVFFVLRSQASTIQCVLCVGEKVSKQMVKFVGNITKESLIDVEGKVSTIDDIGVNKELIRNGTLYHVIFSQLFMQFCLYRAFVYKNSII